MPMPGSCGPITPPESAYDRRYREALERMTDRDIVCALTSDGTFQDIAQAVLRNICDELPEDAILEHLAQKHRDWIETVLAERAAEGKR